MDADMCCRGMQYEVAPVRGYKGMDADMRCRGMQYEVGKTYHIDGEPKICRIGLHFCKEIIDVFTFYGNNGKNRFFEVEASETVICDGKKSVTNCLKIIRELSTVEVNRAYYGCCYGYETNYIYFCMYSLGYEYGHGHSGEYGNGNGFGQGYGKEYEGEYGNGYGNGDCCGDEYGGGCGTSYFYGYNEVSCYNLQCVLKFDTTHASRHGSY